MFSKNVSPFFLTQICVFYQKERLIFTYYNVKIDPVPFKSPIFSEILVSKKNVDLDSIFFCTFSHFKVGIIY